MVLTWDEKILVLRFVVEVKLRIGASYFDFDWHALLIRLRNRTLGTSIPGDLDSAASMWQDEVEEVLRILNG